MRGLILRLAVDGSLRHSILTKPDWQPPLASLARPSLPWCKPTLSLRFFINVNTASVSPFLQVVILVLATVTVLNDATIWPRIKVVGS